LLGELKKAEKDYPDPWNLMRIIPMKGSWRLIVYTIFSLFFPASKLCAKVYVRRFWTGYLILLSGVSYD